MIRLIIIVAIVFTFSSVFVKKRNAILEKFDKKIYIIDAFTYFQESQMLSIRLFRMNKFVDYFLIVISKTTHSGMPLTISFSPYEDLIEKYRTKMIFYNISFPSNFIYSWDRESNQRMAIADGIKKMNVSNESLVIISDLDEIPTSDAMKYIKEKPPQILYMLSGHIFYYNYRHKMMDIWPGVSVIKVSECNKELIWKCRAERYRYSRTNSIPIHPSLTHCSYCYSNISSIQKKLASFAHTEFSKPPYTERGYIKSCIKNHESLFNHSKIAVVEYDSKLLPLPNDKRFNFLKEKYEIL